jgi:hypothetical protein
MRMSAVFSVCVVLLFVAAFSNPGRACADHSETHDGFFLRLSTGIGFASVKGDSDNSGTFKGATGQGSIAVGGMIVDNLAIHADFFATTLFNPDYEINGTTSSTPNNFEVAMRAATVGAGLTYYFMPVNLYLTASLGIAYVSTEVSYTSGGVSFKNTYESETGLGLNVMLGKEWWITDNWGLGVAGQLIYFNIPVKDKDSASDNFSGASFGALFSATYN